MMQIPLWNDAPTVAHLHATFVEGLGWHLSIWTHTHSAPMADARREVYERMTAAEMIDVVLEAFPSLFTGSVYGVPDGRSPD